MVILGEGAVEKAPVTSRNEACESHLPKFVIGGDVNSNDLSDVVTRLDENAEFSQNMKRSSIRGSR